MQRFRPLAVGVAIGGTVAGLGLMGLVSAATQAAGQIPRPRGEDLDAASQTEVAAEGPPPAVAAASATPAPETSGL